MRRIALTFLLLMSFLLVPAAAFAQTDECSGPLDFDSGLLADSREAMMALESYATNADIGISLLDAPNLPNRLTFDLGLDGEFALDPELTARMQALQDLDPAEAEANIDEIFGVIVELYQTIAFNMDMKIDMSDDLADLIAANARVSRGMIPSTVNLPTRMTEGFFYFDVDDIARNFEVPPGVEGWFGIDYGTLMADSIDQALAALEAGEAAGSVGDMATSMGATMALQESIKQYASAEAVGTSRESGTDVCEVVVTYDIAGFLSDPAFISMITDQMKAQVAMQEEMGVQEGQAPMSEADIEMISSMAPMLAPMLLSGLVAESTSLIGLEDALVYSSETNIEWDMGSLMSVAAAMMNPGSAPEQPRNAPVFAMSVSQENSSFDEPFEVEVPDPVQIIPLEAVQQSAE